jgi:hypothetical protein
MRWNYLLAGCVALAGCAEAVTPNGGGAGYSREVRGGNLHRASVDGVTTRSVDFARLVASAEPMRAVLGDLESRDFVATTFTAPTAGGAPLSTVYAQQMIDGVAVHGAYLYLATQPDATGGGRLLASSYHLYQGPDVAVAPTVERARR